MRAVTIPAFGAADVLGLGDVRTPEPGPGQVAIDVAYAGANFAEVLYRRGLVDVPLPFVPGIEVSGHVREVGPDVTGLRTGEPVAALTIVGGGGYAEVVTTAADLVAPLSGTGLGLDVAAAVPSNSTTAFLALDRVGRIEPGESVLVHAAAGGLGSQLGQAARLLGAGRVVGTVGRPEKIEAARAFGYDEVVLRDAPLPGPFDLAVDMVGGAARKASLEALAPMGRLVVLGNASDAPDVAFSANELWLANRAVTGLNLAAFAAAHPAEAGRALRGAVAAAGRGDLRIAVTTLPLERAAEAHERIESGKSTGKIVLAVR